MNQPDQPMSQLGHSRPSDPALTLANVRSYSNSDRVCCSAATAVMPIADFRLLAVLLTNKQIVEPAKDSAADQAVNQRVDRPDNNRTHASARMITGVD